MNAWMKLFKRCQIQHEVAYLAATALLTWSLLYFIMAQSSFSKYSHLVRDYDIYRERIRQDEKSAIEALDQLKLWKAQKHASTHLFAQNTSIANKTGQYICAAIISKKRMGSSVNLAAQSIAALLTRTQLKYENKVHVIVFNVEENPVENVFLNQYLNGLVKVLIFDN